MDWNSIGLSALAGALAGGIGTAIAFALTKDRKKAGILATVLTVVLFSVFRVLANDYLKPLVSPLDADALFAEVSQEFTLLDRLESFDPAFHRDLKVDFSLALERGESPEQAGNALGARAAEYALKLLPKASDQTVADYSVMVNDSLDALIGRDTDLCFRFLFPHVDGAIDPTRFLPESLVRHQLSLFAQTVETYDPERPAPTAEQFQALFNPVVQSLVEQHGQAAVVALSAPEAPDIDRAQTCLIVRELYGKITALPENDAVTVYRALYAQ